MASSLTTPLRRGLALDAIKQERDRQERLKRDGRFLFTCADDGMDDAERLAVLLEEVGEVARVLNDGEGADRLREEVTQVAAVAAAWIESLL